MDDARLSPVNQLAFDEQTGRQLEALYQIDDAVLRRRLARTALAPARGERILDVGCGPGFFCTELLEEVGEHGRVTGLDASPQMLALARRRCAERENIAFAEADATSLPAGARVRRGLRKGARRAASGGASRRACSGVGHGLGDRVLAFREP